MASDATKALYKVTEAAEVLSLSRAELYEQMAAGRLRFVKVGRARRVPAGAIADFVALLEQESQVAA
ncbi:helix-turn-helix domain-containing protein [Streptomonospora wellingtoniae]|uniref:Helix-turn-helix domain-containing protein n=1 Tax=Streptomonospora wellingtoniae TaxID=3075544 RepID=A0ABU2KY70_9ACTN|nr:helix-turn-helix domain-containing protein [Streptomonospora sp. DSM 45055]MDT0303983.1 helix-turn-helix domain-containing protein [Streptomonospora sp. DSM 45055]